MSMSITLPHAARAIVAFTTLIAAACGGASDRGGAISPSVTATAPVASSPRAGSSSSAPRATPAACDLLTPSDASAIFVGKPIAGPDTNQSGGNDCLYGVKVDGTAVYVAVLPTSAFDAAREGATSGTTIAPLSGVGDDAFFERNSLVRTELFVKKGAVAFAVLVKDFDLSVTQLEAAEQMTAQAIAGRF
jgi:hypothetical protein